ncbi:MAG: hypothetical protein QMD14_01680 [Candidatus Aenigmarchaeota archaeon]|nr:hypothetical protein [Candidatus Aenigmarchaeota archaeon]
MKYKFKPRGYEIKITGKSVVVISVIVIGLIISWFIYKSFQPITTIEYRGVIFSFKEFKPDVDLRKVMKVPVYPNDEAISSLVFSPKIKNIFIVFKDSPDNALVALSGVEIGVKLKLALTTHGYKVKSVTNLTQMFEAREQGFLTIFPREIASYDGLVGEEESLLIALVPPILTNETLVKVEDYVIFIMGKNREDFELATIRFLLAAFDIKV